MEVGGATYSGINGAEHAFADARDRDPEARWLDECAFVEVHSDGRVVARGTVAGHYIDFDGLGDAIGPDTAIGTIIGAVVAFPLGPQLFAVGLVAGMAGGGAVQTHHQLPKVEGRAFDVIREQLPEGSSAVVVFSDADTVRAMSDALADTAVKVVHYHLSPAAEAELRSTLAEAPEAQPRGAPPAA